MQGGNPPGLGSLRQTRGDRTAQTGTCEEIIISVISVISVNTGSRLVVGGKDRSKQTQRKEGRKKKRKKEGKKSGKTECRQTDIQTARQIDR